MDKQAHLDAYSKHTDLASEAYASWAKANEQGRHLQCAWEKYHKHMRIAGEHWRKANAAG